MSTTDFSITNFDSALIPHCRFLPWVGQRYERDGVGGLRVLVLGEAHYEWDDRPANDYDVTRAVIDMVMTIDRRHTFHSGVARAVMGTEPRLTLEAIREFWRRVA